MKSPMPWVCLVALSNASFVYADEGLDAYREGHYLQAAQKLTGTTGKDPVVEYYMGRMRLYGYGQLKNNVLAMRHFKEAAERGFLPAQRIMARVALFEENNPEQAAYWFKKSADANDLPAQMYCAAAYLFGVGVKQNQDLAKRYYIAAAKNGDSIAQYTVAESFLETRHAANKTLGLIWLNKSVAQNNPEAQLMLGELYTNGTLVEKDLPKAKELVGLSLAQGYVPALYQMGEIARAEDDVQAAQQWYMKASTALYVPADVALAKLYLQEKSPLYDVNAAFLWMLRAAQNGSSEAQTALAAMYKQGIGVAADENLAKEWQQKSLQTSRGTPAIAQMKAALWLSNRHVVKLEDTQFALKGILTPWKNKAALKDNIYNQAPQMDTVTREQLYRPAFALTNPNTIPISEYYNAWLATVGELPKDHWDFPIYPLSLKEADNAPAHIKQIETQAVLGDFTAQFELAERYQQGSGVEKNIEQAMKYYQMAADQQDLRAQYMLGILHMEGKEIPANYTKGMTILEDAAFKGNSQAQYALARIYEQGYQDATGKMVIEPNMDKAISMYQLASSNDYGQAQFRLAELFAREKPTDISSASIQQRAQLIKTLYQGAVSGGVSQAALPLAFFNAMDKDKAKQKLAFDVATKEANADSIPAALLLGLMYDRGIAVDADHEEAMSWYKKAELNPVADFVLGTYSSETDSEKGQTLLQKAADANFSYAYLNSAVLLQQAGKPFLPQLEKALSLGNSTAGLLLADYHVTQASDSSQLKQAHDIYLNFAQKGDKNAQLKLAYMLEQGLGVNADRVNAQTWYTQSAEQGQPVAQYLLGRLYQMGWIGSAPDYELAKKWYSTASANYAPAAVALGFVYDTVDDDYQHAQVSYHQAAALGDLIGEFNEALLYEKGKGIPVDFEKASSLYLSAAKQGQAQAMVQLAGLYFHGLNGSRNEAEAVAWYKKAATLGDRDALYHLGLLSETGVGVSLDYSEALRYYKESSEKGNAKAILAQARMYQHGLGVAKDPQQAIALYKSLAAQDNAYAQYQLAMLYMNGATGEPQLAQGKQLLMQAEKNGSIQAQKALQRLTPKAPDQVSVLEPAVVVPSTVTSDKSPDLMYFDALNALNRGDESASKVILSQIMTQYPDYTLAKRVYEQLS